MAAAVPVGYLLADCRLLLLLLVVEFDVTVWQTSEMAMMCSSLCSFLSHSRLLLVCSCNAAAL